MFTDWLQVFPYRFSFVKMNDAWDRLFSQNITDSHPWLRIRTPVTPYRNKWQLAEERLLIDDQFPVIMCTFINTSYQHAYQWSFLTFNHRILSCISIFFSNSKQYQNKCNKDTHTHNMNRQPCPCITAGPGIQAVTHWFRLKKWNWVHEKIMKNYFTLHAVRLLK